MAPTKAEAMAKAAPIFAAILRRLESESSSAAEPSPSMTIARPPRVAVGGESSAARPTGRGTISTTPHVVEENTPSPGDDAGLAADLLERAS